MNVIRVQEVGIFHPYLKWYGENKIRCLGLNDYDDYALDKDNDLDLTKTIHRLIDEADLTIAHNGDRFDTRKVHARFAIHGLNPPSPVRSIDTLKVARKYFAFTSNRLNDLGEVLGLGKKESTGGFQLWLDCMAGDARAWARMKKITTSATSNSWKMSTIVCVHGWITTRTSPCCLGISMGAPSVGLMISPNKGSSTTRRPLISVTNVTPVRAGVLTPSPRNPPSLRWSTDEYPRPGRIRSQSHKAHAPSPASVRFGLVGDPDSIR